MKKTIFYGSAVALITPMNKDYSVNYEKIKELVNWQIENKTDAIVACGTTAESATLTEEEKLKVIETIVKETKNKVPVIAGTGSNNTKTTIEFSKRAKELNVDAILVVTPYYNKASQSGLLKHYNQIADSVNIPLIVYDVPSRTGCKIDSKTFSSLKNNKNIVAVKAASGDMSQISKIAANCKEELKIYSGDDGLITPIMSIGGAGVISVLANILPEQTHNICSHYLKNNPQKSAQLQLELLDLINTLFVEVNPIPVKAAMNLMNFNVGPCRMPLSEIDDEKLEILKQVLKKHKLI